MKYRYLLLCIFFYTQLIYAEDEEAYMHVHFHNVGQGNSTSITFYDPNQPDPALRTRYMLVDCGSDGFVKERIYGNILKKKYQEQLEAQLAAAKMKPSKVSLPPLSPVKTAQSSTTATDSTSQLKAPTSVVKVRDQSIHDEFQSELETKSSITNEDLVNEIRASLGGFVDEIKPTRTRSKISTEKKKIPLNVQLVILSHADSDHCNMAPELFSQNEDIIGTLVLGGLPEDYSSVRFNKFLKKCFTNKTKVYFPAISTEPVTGFDDKNFFLPDDVSRLQWAKKNSYAPHMFSHPLKSAYDFKSDQLLFGGALDFGDKFQIHMMSINSSHMPSGRDEKFIMRMNNSEDKNVDSLVVRAAYTNDCSVMIMGDAVAQNNMCIQNNYRDTETIRATIYCAAHHGSHTNGSNSADLLGDADPSFMIISAGLQHGHPTLGTHANCNELNLATVKKHFVGWGFKKSKQGQTYELHESQRGIFSTFDSGSLVAKFKLGKPITIECTRFNITYTDLSIANQNIAAISPTKVDNKRALDDELEAVNSITPSKKQKSNVIAMPASPVDNRVKTSKRKLFTD